MSNLIGPMAPPSDRKAKIRSVYKRLRWNYVTWILAGLVLLATGVLLIL